MPSGIQCPACQTVDQYASHQGGPGKGGNQWERRKKCKKCGAIFITLELPIGLVPDQAPVQPIQPEAPTPVAPATPAPTAPVQPINPIFMPQTQA